MSSADQCSIAAILVIAGCIHGASLSLPFTQIWDLVDYKRSKLNNTLVSLIVIEWLWLCCTVGLEAFTCSSNLIGTGVMISNRAQYLNNFISPAVLASVSIIQCSRLVVLRVSESIQKICYISTGILLIGNWIFFNWMSAFSLNGAQGNFVIIESLLNLFFFSLSIQVLIIDLLITQKLRQLLVQGEIAINPRQRTIIVRQLVLTLTPALVTVADIIVWAYFSYDKDGFKYSPIGNFEIKAADRTSHSTNHHHRQCIGRSPKYVDFAISFSSVLSCQVLYYRRIQIFSDRLKS